MKNLPALIEAICVAYDDPLFRESNGTTYCNEAANFMASRLGCNDFVGLMANDIVDFVSASPNWSMVPMDKAQDLANQGSVVYAMLKDTPHGHICIVRPGMVRSSGMWNCQVPSVMNIGAERWTSISKGLNYAFHDVPQLYVWRPSL